MGETVAASPADDSRFRKLLDQHHRAIQVYCFRRLPNADAQEATSDVFVIAWQKRSNLPEDNEVRLWLYGVARNVVRNFTRGHRRRQRLEARALSISELAPAETEHQVVRRAEDQLVTQAAALLSERDQEVLMLHAWEGLTAAEIAKTLEISDTAAHMRLQRAVKRLAKALQRVGYDAPVTGHPHAIGEGGAT